MTSIRSSDESASEWHDVFGALAVENSEIARWKQPLKAIAKAQHFPAKLIGGQGGATQDSVKPGAVPTAGENADPRFHPRGRLQYLFRVDQSPGSGPLIVELPSLPDKAFAIAKTIVAAENHHDQVPAKNCRALVAVLDHLGGSIGGEDQTLTGKASLPGFDPIDAIGPEQIVGGFQDSVQLFTAAIEGNFAF